MLSKGKNKKGLSVMIGYVLLISFVIVISAIVYTWLKTYVPTESPDCPEGTSLFIKSYSCNGTQLNMTIKNNGRFDVAGYFIHVTDSPNQTLANIDLSSELQSGGSIYKNSVILVTGSTNSLKSSQEMSSIFDGTSLNTSRFYSIEIIPARFQEADNRIRFVTCGNSKIEEELEC